MCLWCVTLCRSLKYNEETNVEAGDTSSQIEHTQVEISQASDTTPPTGLMIKLQF